MLTLGDVLRQRGEDLLAQPRQQTVFTGDKNADDLLNDVENYPHAFVIACLMDRQWQAEKCWSVPYRFKERLGSFEFGTVAALPLDRIASMLLVSCIQTIRALSIWPRGKSGAIGAARACWIATSAICKHTVQQLARFQVRRLRIAEFGSLRSRVRHPGPRVIRGGSHSGGAANLRTRWRVGLSARG